MTNTKITAEYCRNLQDEYRAKVQREREIQEKEKVEALKRSIYVDYESDETFDDILKLVEERSKVGSYVTLYYNLKKKYVQELRGLGFFYYARPIVNTKSSNRVMYFNEVTYVISPREFKSDKYLKDVTLDNSYDDFDKFRFLHETSKYLGY